MKKIAIIASICLVIITLTTWAQNNYSNQKIQIGQDAPELAFPNPNGRIIKLSEITKGHLVLLDFWASWCRPCRQANPRIVALYKKFKNEKIKGAKKGFTIVSVSLDQNKDAWVNAIANDHLEWENHMSDLNAWGSKTAEIYGIQYVPQAFLISPEGKILAKYNFAEDARLDLEKMIVADK